MQADQFIGQYQIIEPLGFGGMATVFKAFHARLNRYVAIKIIHKRHLEDQTFIARFEREAQIVAQLEHPNIVPVYDFADHEGQPYLVMKLIEGCSLKDVLKEGSLELGDVLSIIPPVANALDYAHQQGVLHRDVKPSNIMLDTKGTPYLTDFGLARLVAVGETTLSRDMLLGTPNYISPEQGLGDRPLDSRSDIYSLGVVIYELFVGKVPFSGTTPMSVVHDHIYRPLPLPSSVNPQIPPQVEAVLLKALAKTPDDRYQSAGELIDALRESIDSSHLVAFDDSRRLPLEESVAQARRKQQAGSARAAHSTPANRASSTPTRPRSRARLWIWAAGALVLAGLIVIALLAVRRPASATAPEIELFPISELSVEQAETAVANTPNDAAAYLSLARAYLVDRDLAKATDTLVEGARYTDDPVRYWLSVGAEALASDRVDFAFVAYREALLRAEASENHLQVRAFVGEQLYNAAQTRGTIEVVSIGRLLAARTESPVPPLLNAMYARALITNGRLQLAEEAINLALERSPDLAEVYLVRGDLYAARNARDTALRDWETARTMEGAPRWVQERATELIEAS